jgi:putative endopeptidase
MAYWGFDIKSIDRSVRPQDDFYRYANGAWLKKTKIPPAESRWGSFTILRYKTEHQLRTLIKEVLKKKAAAGSPAQLVRDTYAAAVDMKTRNVRGVAPLAPLRMLVRDIQSKKDLQKVIARLHVAGTGGAWGAMVDQDSKNSSRYLLHLWQGGLGMPDRDYYLLDAPEQQRVRAAYVAHMGRLLRLAGFSSQESKNIEAAVMRIETALARASMRKEDTRDPHKVYHKLTVAKLKRLAPSVDWAAYFTATHAPRVQELIVGQPEFFRSVSKILNEVSLEDWKAYLEWHVLDDYAGTLSGPFIREQFRWSQTLTGQKKMRPLWRRALGAVGVVGEALGQLYVERYFPPKNKKLMDELVSDLFDVYEKRIKALDWMSPSTKKKAVKKLREMGRKIGYPKKWEKYRGLLIDPKDHFGNMLRSEEWHHRKQMRKLGGPIDRQEWHMTPQTVNAYCSYNLNEIVFPAAILQWPFFAPHADAALNYAGIGTVIGHEMTHGFDDGGAKFDGKGNMRNWWTKKDLERFERKGKLLVQQYSTYKVEGGVSVNGQLTLGENIADLGGLCIGWDAYQAYLHRHGRKTIDGLSPEQRFFLAYAQMERELSRPEFSKTAALTDPHAPAFTRINGPLANFDPFYKSFSLSKKNKLYRAPKLRAAIW